MILIAIFHKKMKKILILILVFLILFSCKNRKETYQKKKETTPVILVSKDSERVFETWLGESVGNDNFKCINMYSVKIIDSLKTLLRMADGIIISGGEDVNPELYGKELEKDRCGIFDNYRDFLEQIMISYAIENKIPLLGICRGHQIMNVTLDGSLIIDIPEDIGSDSLHRNEGRTNHMIYLEKDSYVFNIVKADSGIILSNHHQAVDKIAPDYKISSYAVDKIAESLEPVDTTIHPFILGVQWHPEGMDVNSPFSGNIARKFFSKVNQHYMID